MGSALKKIMLPLREAAHRFVNPAAKVAQPTFIATQDSIIYKAASFVAVNKVDGEYLEFGVFKGASYISAFYTLRHCFDEVINSFGFTMSEADKAVTTSIFGKMRFFAFDSFEGLPNANGTDASGFFEKGQFSASFDEFVRNVKAAGVPEERSVVVRGWYDNTLTPAVCDHHRLVKAAIVHIDCDLYQSTKSVLEFITPLLVDGTVLIFDDWFHFNGHPLRGEQRAFNEWAESLRDWSFSPFQQEGTWRKSFIANQHQASVC